MKKSQVMKRLNQLADFIEDQSGRSIDPSFAKLLISEIDFIREEIR
ncbi:hypothetical protein [Paenibacillus sp. LHD-38]|nr:hypothetical protein [Paenibacillus sp. LHD-38]MDQ8736426.1 hypothetical protein [Paenibacillus sp. LHD-38]